MLSENLENRDALPKLPISDVMHSLINLWTFSLHKRNHANYKRAFCFNKAIKCINCSVLPLKGSTINLSFYQCLYAFVWPSIFSYLKALSQTFILFLSFVVELQNTFCSRLERLTLVQKQKMVKCGSACFVIKRICKDVGLHFHSLATKNLLINPKQIKNRILKTYHFYE